MDWLDQYLHELDRPGAVMHFPPDKQSWHAPVPSKQQMALIQDATVADMVRMRNIQEARQMEIDAAAGGAYDAGSAAGQVTVTSPVKYTNICVSGAGLGAANGTYVYSQAKGSWIRSSSFEWRVGYNAGTGQARWGISAWSSNFPVGDFFYNNTPLATSANPPQTGWIATVAASPPTPLPTVAYAACS
jgi:hypothetical protein